MKNRKTWAEAIFVLQSALGSDLENGYLTSEEYGAALAVISFAEHRLTSSLDEPVNDDAEYDEDGNLLEGVTYGN